MIDKPSFGFGLVYANKLFYCEVIMADYSYLVLFNGKVVIELCLNDYFKWMPVSGTILPNQIVNEIGYRIENYYA